MRLRKCLNVKAIKLTTKQLSTAQSRQRVKELEKRVNLKSQKQQQRKTEAIKADKDNNPKQSHISNADREKNTKTFLIIKQTDYRVNFPFYNYHISNLLFV